MTKCKIQLYISNDSYFGMIRNKNGHHRFFYIINCHSLMFIAYIKNINSMQWKGNSKILALKFKNECKKEIKRWIDKEQSS